jgi:hypothetical protein
MHKEPIATVMKKLAILLGIIFSLVACGSNNDDEYGDPDQPLVFVSLTADNDTISPGETTKIVAVATGYRLAFTWTKSAGIITGSGNQVFYTVPPCDVGRNRITCKVTDGNYVSESKDIYIVGE